jgi:hypothetical protein
MTKLILPAIMLMAVSARATIPGFGAGDLAVLQVGSTTEVQTNTGNSVVIDNFSTNGSMIFAYQVPNSGSDALIISGSASSEGNLSLSADGTSLALAGYNVDVGGSVALASASSTTAPRAFGRMGIGGGFTLEGVITDQFSSNNVRTAVSDGTNNFWVGGGVSGTYYAGFDEPSNTVQSVDANTRVLAIQNGNLYFCVGSGSGTLGIYSFAGTPVTNATPALVLATGSSSSPDNFAFSPSGTTLYIADDNSFSKGGGVQRWDLTGTTWALTYDLKPETGKTGARSIAVDFSGPNPIIYGVTTESTANLLFSIIDTGSTSVATLLSTAPAGANYRSIQLAPHITFPVVTPPSLAIDGLTGGQLILAWPASATGYVLQQDATLGDTNWVAVDTNTYPITVNNGTNTVTITPAGMGAEYFRLINTNQ